MMVFIWILCGIGSVILLFTARHADHLHDKYSMYPSYISRKYKWCKVSYPFLLLALFAFCLSFISLLLLVIVNGVMWIALISEKGERLNIKDVDLCDLINIRISVTSNENRKETK